MRAMTAALSRQERLLVVLLGIPSAGLSSCLTVLSTYLPLLARRFTSSTAIIGLLVGLEMLFCGWAWIMLALEIKNIPADVGG